MGLAADKILQPGVCLDLAGFGLWISGGFFEFTEFFENFVNTRDECRAIAYERMTPSARWTVHSTRQDANRTSELECKTGSDETAACQICFDDDDATAKCGH
jgi:hypothetical protein